MNQRERPTAGAAMTRNNRLPTVTCAASADGSQNFLVVKHGVTPWLKVPKRDAPKSRWGLSSIPHWVIDWLAHDVSLPESSVRRLRQRSATVCGAAFPLSVGPIRIGIDLGSEMLDFPKKSLASLQQVVSRPASSHLLLRPVTALERLLRFFFGRPVLVDSLLSGIPKSVVPR